MGATVYDCAAERVVRDRMKDTAWAGVITEAIVKLNNGFWDSWYIDFFFQKGGWMNQSFTLEDAYVFSVLHTHLGMGDIVACDLRIGESPSADSEVDTNLAKLRKGLSNLTNSAGGVACPVFDVSLWCGLADEDGALSWSPYLEFHSFADGKPHHTEWLTCDRFVPIEVGSQASAKTLVQLSSLGALARWPYGSDTIRVFYVVRPWGNSYFPYQTDENAQAVHP